MFNEGHLLEISSSDDLLNQSTVLLSPDERAGIATFDPTPAQQLNLAGRVIGQYHIKELIGRGSFGEVYRAIDPRLDRDVAIKVAAHSITEDPRLRELFWNEARIQARLEHSNIVPIYDLVEEAGHLAIVMRLIHGEDLDKRLKQMSRPFTPTQTLALMRHVSSALGSAHDRSVIHQDLKPGNIRLTPSGEAVVLDFGVARITGQVTPHQASTSGTPGYMSPEQIRGEPVDARSDIYGLAMTLYKTLTGRHPFEGAGNVGELLTWQLEREPPPPTQFNTSIPWNLSEIILQGLAKNPRERFRACADFTHAVSLALGTPNPELSIGGDGRWDPRAAVNLAAEMRLPGLGTIRAKLIDLSVTGAALRLAKPLPIGSRGQLTIRIPLKTSAHMVRCSMRVLRVMAAPRPDEIHVGVLFEDLSDFDRLVLSDLVRAVLIFKDSR